MAVAGVRAGFFLRHLPEYRLRCSALFSQRRIFDNYHQCSPCLVKPAEVNFISTSSVLLKEKSKNKEKSKAKIHKVDDNELGNYIDVSSLRSKLSAEVEKMKHLFVTQLSIRSSVGLIEAMKVEFEGKTYELQDLAQVAKKGKNMLAINMAGFPQATVIIMKALRNNSLGLNPSQDGTLITVQLPRTTKEHRENLAKQAKAAFVECKKHINRIVNNFNKEVQKEESISKDEIHRVGTLLRLVENEYLQTAENALKTKQEELKLEE